MKEIRIYRRRPPKQNGLAGPSLGIVLVALSLLVSESSQAVIPDGRAMQLTNSSAMLSKKAIPVQPSYVVLASQYIEPGAPYRVVVTLYKSLRLRFSTMPSTVYVRILRQGTVVASETRECYVGSTEIIIIKIPDHFRSDDDSTSYSLDVEGNSYGKLHGSLFQHISKIKLKRQHVRVILQTEQNVYRQKQTVRMRAIPVGHGARPWLEPIDIFLHDPRGMEISRWTARSAASGPIQVEYELAEPTILGQWTISAAGRGFSSQKSRTTAHFEVVNYNPVGFEVKVWTKDSFVPSDGSVDGWVEAEGVGGGAPVQGWLEMNATVTTLDGAVCDRSLSFDKLLPGVRNKISFKNGNSNKVQINGRFIFGIDWSDLNDYCSVLKVKGEYFELKITATVTKMENGQRVSAYSTSVLYLTNIRMGFSLASPATFHPELPFLTWVWAQRGDGRPLPSQILEDSQMLVTADLVMKDDSVVTIPPFPLLRSRQRGKNKHMWKINLDLKEQCNEKLLENLKSVSLQSKFLMDEHSKGRLYLDMEGISEMVLIPAKHQMDSEKSLHQLQVTTSTLNPKVGENIILHIRSNFYLSDFHLVVTSAGQILTTKVVNMGQSFLQTFDELITAEMAPEATFTVWQVDSVGDIVSSSMNVIIHSHEKARISAHPVLEGQSGYSHVVVRGEPNSILSLSATNADQRERNHFNEDLIGIFEDRNLQIQNGIPFPAKLEPNHDDNLIVMSDRYEGSRTVDSSVQRRFAKFQEMSVNEDCRGEVIKCDGKCQCATCEDEVECLSTSKFRPTASPTTNELEPTGFWKLVRIPSNGSAILKVPFNVQGRISISALSFGPKGISTIRGQTFSIGSYMRSSLTLPDRCHLGERVSIRLTCINKGSGTLKRTFEVAPAINDRAFEFLNVKGERMDVSSRRIEVSVPAHSYQVVHIPILPNQIGMLTVRARIDNNADQLIAQTLVKEEGIDVVLNKVQTIDLNERSYFVGNIAVKKVHGAAQGKSTLTVSSGVVGPLTPFNITSSIRRPQITADEAIFTILRVVLERKYQRSASARGRVSETSEAYATSALSQAFQRLVAHQRVDGAVSYFNPDTGAPPSIFLTANLLRVLYEVHSQFEQPIVDPLILIRSLEWMIRQQAEDGSFKEKFVYNGEYQRKLPVEFQEIALTAHVMIALSPFIEKTTLWNVSYPIAKAANYLVSRLGTLDKSATSLDTALVSRALQVTRSHGAEAAFEILAKRRRDQLSKSFWGHPDDCDSSLSVRASSYALMVYTERGEFMTEPIVDWINSMRKSASGWGSSVDTMVATEALVYWSMRFGGSVASADGGSKLKALQIPESLALEINSNGDDVDADRRSPFVVISSGSDITRVIPLGTVGEHGVRIEARGRGVALAHLETKFTTTNTRHLMTDNLDMEKNNVAIHFEPRLEFLGGDSSEIKVLSCQRWDCNKDLSVSGPIILTMAIPTGYILDHDESKRIENLGLKVWIVDGEINIFYHKLTSDFECVDFTLRRDFPVARLSPYIPMKVYDWFSPDRRNETLLFVPKLNSVSVCDVCGSYECTKCSADTRQLSSRAFSSISCSSQVSLVVSLVIAGAKCLTFFQ